MRNLIFLLSMLAFGGVAYSQDTGRFQLVSASVPFVSAPGKSAVMPTVFRIDTATGKTWIYYPAVHLDKTNTDAGWIEVSEFEEKQHLDLQPVISTNTTPIVPKSAP